MTDKPATDETGNCPGFFDPDFLAGDAFAITAPERQTVPLVFASPHSGWDYPAAFLAQSCLDPLSLRHSEDAFVDELFDQVPDLGAPLIAARFPRVYVDANREATELDPAMFSEPLPVGTSVRSPRVAAGLGTIARIVSDGQEIYNAPLRYDDVKHRIEQCYVPYHRALRGLVENTLRQFGVCLVVDCHSMPSHGREGHSVSQGSGSADLVLGDCWGSSCHSAISDLVERAARDQGFGVLRNTPYAGGFTTRHYGCPSQGVHAIQLEIDRALYMDELSIVRLASFDDMRRKLTGVARAMTEAMAGRDWERLAAE